jgi:hypothetical protein
MLHKNGIKYIPESRGFDSNDEYNSEDEDEDFPEVERHQEKYKSQSPSPSTGKEDIPNERLLDPMPPQKSHDTVSIIFLVSFCSQSN